MTKSQRLLEIARILQDAGTVRAEALAQRLSVSIRTIYRDMDALIEMGVPVQGTKGQGYRMQPATVLPPLSLLADEVEALNLGLAILLETPDPELRAAAERLADKVDAALPEVGVAADDGWKSVPLSGASTARALAHLATVRAAIRTRQKLLVDGPDRVLPSGNRRIRPLRLQFWGRAWVLTGWSDSDACFVEMRTDLMRSATPLPELFVDEPGKTLADFETARS